MLMPRTVLADVTVESRTLHTNMKNKPSVLSAALNSGGTSTSIFPLHAPVTVVRSYESGTEDVYDLTVDTAHEFVAEGVIVHNCWGLTELALKPRGKAGGISLHHGY